MVALIVRFPFLMLGGLFLREAPKLMKLCLQNEVGLCRHLASGCVQPHRGQNLAQSGTCALQKIRYVIFGNIGTAVKAFLLRLQFANSTIPEIGKLSSIAGKKTVVSAIWKWLGLEWRYGGLSTSSKFFGHRTQPSAQTENNAEDNPKEGSDNHPQDQQKPAQPRKIHPKNQTPKMS